LKIYIYKICVIKKIESWPKGKQSRVTQPVWGTGPLVFLAISGCVVIFCCNVQIIWTIYANRVWWFPQRLVQPFLSHTFSPLIYSPTQPLFARRKIQIQITVFLLLLLSFCNSIAIHSINTIWLPIMGTQSSFAFPASCLIWWSLLPVFWFIRFCRSFLLFIGLVRAFLDLLLHDFCSDLSGKISECVVWVVEAVVVLLDDLVFSTPDSESWIWFLISMVTESFIYLCNYGSMCSFIFGNCFSRFYFSFSIKWIVMLLACSNLNRVCVFPIDTLLLELKILRNW